MIELEKISSKNKRAIASLCDLMLDLHNEFYLADVFSFLKEFISFETIKEEILSEKQVFYLIKEDKNIIGFIKLVKITSSYYLTDFFTIKSKRDLTFLKSIFNLFLELYLEDFKIFVNKNLQLKFDFYLPFGFKKNARCVLYQGNEIYLDGFELEKV